jgi:hypothetical protein
MRGSSAQLWASPRSSSADRLGLGRELTTRLVAGNDSTHVSGIRADCMQLTGTGMVC